MNIAKAAIVVGHQCSLEPGILEGREKCGRRGSETGINNEYIK